MNFKRSMSLTLITLSAVAVLGLAPAEFRAHRHAVLAGRQRAAEGEQGLILAGTICPTATNIIIGRDLHLTVPINSAVKKGDVIGTDDSPDALAGGSGVRQELDDATAAQQQAEEVVRHIEEELATAQLGVSSMDREEARAWVAAFDAERELDRTATLLHAGLSSRADFNAAAAAQVSAETAVDSVRSSISAASIETDELEAKALAAKADFREATTRRSAAAMAVEQMQGNVENKPIVSPADGTLVASERPEGTIFAIAVDGGLVASAMLPEADLMHVRVGQEALITLDGEPAVIYRATVSSIEETPVVLANGSFYQVTLVVENAGGSGLLNAPMHARLAPEAPAT